MLSCLIVNLPTPTNTNSVKKDAKNRPKNRLRLWRLSDFDDSSDYDYRLRIDCGSATMTTIRAVYSDFLPGIGSRGTKNSTDRSNFSGCAASVGL